MNGTVEAIFICPTAGEPMQEVKEVEAIKGRGLKGDRYEKGAGSFNKKDGVGNRQVTLINVRFFPGSGFTFAECRRNIVVKGVELNWLADGRREFEIGAARMRGVKYCDPCGRPSKLVKKEIGFKEAFEDCGGIIAEVIESGIIKVGDAVIPPPKGY